MTKPIRRRTPGERGTPKRKRLFTSDQENASENLQRLLRAIKKKGIPLGSPACMQIITDCAAKFLAIKEGF